MSSVFWKLYSSGHRIPFMHAVRTFASKSPMCCEKDRGKRTRQTDVLPKDKTYKDMMTAEKWHGDIMTRTSVPGDIMTSQEQHRNIMTNIKQHGDVIVASKIQADVITEVRKRADVIPAQEEHGEVMTPPKELKNIIAASKKKEDVMTASLPCEDIVAYAKETHDIMQSEKQHVEVSTGLKNYGDIMHSIGEHGDVMTASEPKTNITTSSKLPEDVMISEETSGDDDMMRPLHVPVMSEEVLGLMNPQDGQIIFDLTFGAGGHSKQILEQAPGCQIYALDRDPQAHQLAIQLALERGPERVVPLLGRFSELPQLLGERGVKAGCVDAVLMDLGASSMQFDQPLRGFRVSADGPLDMRMDAGRLSDQMTAADVVNTLDEVALTRILSRYGEEKHARSIATAIVESRYAFGDIKTTGQLTKIINSVFTDGYQRQDKLRRHSHVATKTFQALRIFVNDELNELAFALKLSHRLLSPQGSCIAISFHSLEDRLVKRAFSSRAAEDKEAPRLKVDRNFDKRTMAERKYKQTVTEQDLSAAIEKKWSGHEYFEPSLQEVARNPRARSAKLRVARKL